MKVYRLLPLLVVSSAVASQQSRLDLLLQKAPVSFTLTFTLLEKTEKNVSRPLDAFAGGSLEREKNTAKYTVTISCSGKKLLYLVREKDKLHCAMSYDGAFTDYYDARNPRLYHLKGATFWLNQFIFPLPLNPSALNFFKPAPKINEKLPEEISGIGVILPESNTRKSVAPTYVAAFVRESTDKDGTVVTVNYDSDSLPSAVASYRNWKPVSNSLLPQQILWVRKDYDLSGPQVKVTKYLRREFRLQEVKAAALPDFQFEITHYAKPGDPLQDENLATKFVPGDGSYEQQLARERKRIEDGELPSKTDRSKSGAMAGILIVGLILGGTLFWVAKKLRSSR